LYYILDLVSSKVTSAQQCMTIFIEKGEVLLFLAI
jgi:hypothetical protein